MQPNIDGTGTRPIRLEKAGGDLLALYPVHTNDM